MFKITKDYYLGSYRTNFALFQKKISESGKETMKNIGYYSNLEQVYDALIKKEISDNMELLNNIKEIVSLVNELKEFTKKYIAENNKREN